MAEDSQSGAIVSRRSSTQKVIIPKQPETEESHEIYDHVRKYNRKRQEQYKKHYPKEVIRDQRRKYIKKWRKENKEKFLAYCRTYRQKNREKLREYRRAYYQKNRKSLLEYYKIYRQTKKPYGIEGIKE